MGHKGQSALEYLITYGWMVLVVAIAGAVVFTTTSDEDSNLQTEGLSGSFPSITEIARSTDEKIAVELENPRQDTVFVREVEFSQNGTVVYSSSVDRYVSGRSSTGLKTANYDSSEETNEYNITVRYGPGLVSQSRISGKISIVELVAAFSANPEVKEQGEIITLNASDSYDSEIIENYSWSFRDGQNSSGKVVNHTYINSGIYTVTLNISDGEGNQARKTKVLTVGQVIFRKGGYLPSLGVKSLGVDCMGIKCENSSAGGEEPVDIGGGTIKGTLLADKIINTSSETCITSTESLGSSGGCDKTEEDRNTFLSIHNYSMQGSLNVRVVKPFEKLCVGSDCEYSNP